MKRLLVMLLLMLGSSLLLARPTMMNLEFDLSAEECSSILEQQGLKFLCEDQGKQVYIPQEKQLYNEVWLYFDGDDTSLNQWTINFPNASDTLDVEHAVFEQMIALHGEDYKWSEWMELYSWSLGDNAYAQCGWNCGDDYYFANYYR